MRKRLQLTVLLCCIIYLNSAFNLTKAMKERKDICTLNSAYGSCSKRIVRWYYSFVSDRCLSFQYSSCGGNANRFKSRSACENYCMDPENRYKMQDFENEYFNANKK